MITVEGDGIRIKTASHHQLISRSYLNEEFDGFGDTLVALAAEHQQLVDEVKDLKEGMAHDVECMTQMLEKLTKVTEATAKASDDDAFRKTGGEFGQ